MKLHIADPELNDVQEIDTEKIEALKFVPDDERSMSAAAKKWAKEFHAGKEVLTAYELQERRTWVAQRAVQEREKQAIKSLEDTIKARLTFPAECKKLSIDVRTEGKRTAVRIGGYCGSKIYIKGGILTDEYVKEFQAILDGKAESERRRNAQSEINAIGSRERQRVFSSLPRPFCAAFGLTDDSGLSWKDAETIIVDNLRVRITAENHAEILALIQKGLIVQK